MIVDAEDWRPPSAFGRSSLRPGDWLAGLLAALAAHTAVPVAVGAVAGLLAVTGLLGPEPEVVEPAPEEPPVEIIEAKLVKLGRQLPKHKLPNKEVPTATQAPPKPSDKPNPFAKKIETPPDAGIERSADDMLAILGNRADELSKRKFAWDQEGDINGIEEGTEKPGEGDVYAGILYNFFRRGWTVPTSITDEELKSLKCTVVVDITEDAKVGGFRVANASGNSDFDDSVRLRVSQAEGAQLPQPPESVAAQYLGRSVSLRFLGPHARR
ncbi:MAG: TonB C-terminal domain-containing protein [Polyangiales bacterium]|nr:TonB C-terminal domain-containing protein [Myxococcales bacterium]